MVSTTDIPDWTTVECGVPYNPSSILKPELYSTLYSMSPIQYTDQVKTPVLLRMGDVDQRVPPSQGKEYYHLLKARGMGDKVQMLWFPENGHPLDKVEAERTGWEATLAWFQRFSEP
jgi:dipeptidyl aminopeptidase/acylaminoacyl peptidase